METKHVRLTWQDGLRFSGEGAGRVPIVIDGDNAAGPGPMEALLLALASCTASDVVGILEKKRVTLAALDVEVDGDRREEYPRCYAAIRLTFRMRGEGLTESHARQAVDLSLEKYCSVVASLKPGIPVTYALDLQA